MCQRSHQRQARRVTEIHMHFSYAVQLIPIRMHANKIQNRRANGRENKTRKKNSMKLKNHHYLLINNSMIFITCTFWWISLQWKPLQLLFWMYCVRALSMVHVAHIPLSHTWQCFRLFCFEFLLSVALNFMFRINCIWFGTRSFV